TNLTVWDAFQIPFTYVREEAGGNHVMRFGAIVIGYEMDTTSVRMTDDGRRLPHSATRDCDLGSTIVQTAPWTIVEVGKNDQLAEVAQIDATPKYYWWHLQRQSLRVRFAQRIPVTYLVNGMIVPGHVVVAFNH